MDLIPRMIGSSQWKSGCMNYNMITQPKICCYHDFRMLWRKIQLTENQRMEKAKICRSVRESWPRVATPIMGGSGFHRNSSSKNLALDFLEPQHKHPHTPPELPRFFQTTSSKVKFRSAAQTLLRGKKKSAVACTIHKMFSIHKKCSEPWNHYCYEILDRLLLLLVFLQLVLVLVLIPASSSSSSSSSASTKQKLCTENKPLSSMESSQNLTNNRLFSEFFSAKKKTLDSFYHCWAVLSLSLSLSLSRCVWEPPVPVPFLSWFLIIAPVR